MASFINMLGSDVWSEADIKVRLHAEIRSEFSEMTETELNRALQGAALGLHTLTAEEQQTLMGFKAATDRASALGVAARADRSLLADAMSHEAAQARLALAPYLDPAPDADALPVEVDLEHAARVAADLQSRAAAQAVIDAASAGVIALCAERAASRVTIVPSSTLPPGATE